MFDKIKQLKQLKEIQNEFKKEKIEVEKNGIKMVFNGSMELEELNLNHSLDTQEQEKIIIVIFNEAIRKIQMNIAQKMSQFKDIGL